MFRVLTSWRLLAAGFATAVVLFGLLAHSIQAFQEQQTREQLVTEAKLISTLLVGVRLVDGTAGPVLPTASVALIDRGVAHLVAEDRLVGLQLWTSDERLLYTDVTRADPLTGSEIDALVDVRAGNPRVEFEHDEGRDVPTATVLLQPSGVDGASSGLVLEVLLPEHDVVAALSRASRVLYLSAALLFAAVVTVAVVARRRLLRREHQALHDSLTGLGNREQLAVAGARLADERRGRSDTRGVTALLLLDLDRFKEVNDTLGHAVGDQLLIGVADALRGAVRPTDVVTRLGGDEFAVLLYGLPSADAAVRAAGAIADVLQRPFSVDRVTLEVGVSIGVAVHREHGNDLSTLLRHADVAMYQAKREGGGVRLYDAATDPHDEAQLDLLSQLRSAIDTGQLRLHFQPKVALRAGQTVGFEALVRWAHPEQGLLPPSAFLPQAERTALMRPLTYWVLRAAITQCAGWRAAGWDVDVAVNVAPTTLLDPDLPAALATLLAEAGLPGHALELEMTETAVMIDPVQAAQTVRHLQAMGVGVSIDDFGAGYTSLSYLKTLPVRSLKIDRGFVTHLLDDDKDEAVTRSIVQLGHDLGLTVVAEGVETAEVRQRLLELGCDEAQGYLMARPMEPDAVLGWLTSQAADAVHKMTAAS